MAGGTLEVLSTHALQEVLRALGPAFERDSGYRLAVSYDPAKALKRRIEDGTPFDLVIATRPVVDALTEGGHVLAGSSADIGRSGLGVSVRKGAAKPDIGTVEAFRRALLAAKSIVRSTEGTSGLYFEQLVGRLGLADALRGKIKLGPSGRVAELVAHGEADMAVQQISELLPVAGADFVGPFPAKVQLWTVFSAGIGTVSRSVDAARSLIDLLIAPAADAVLAAQGLERPPR